MTNSDTRTPASPAAPTAAVSVQEPEQFELRGGDVTITYSTTSLTGAPQFNYQDKARSVNVSGDAIRVEQTAIARLVTVALEQVPDAYTLSVTLLIPQINLRDPNRTASLETLAVLTTDRSSAFTGPAGVEGQLQSYEARVLTGTASRVDF